MLAPPRVLAWLLEQEAVGHLVGRGEEQAVWPVGLGACKSDPRASPLPNAVATTPNSWRAVGPVPAP